MYNVNLQTYCSDDRSIMTAPYPLRAGVALIKAWKLTTDWRMSRLAIVPYDLLLSVSEHFKLFSFVPTNFKTDIIITALSV